MRSTTGYSIHTVALLFSLLISCINCIGVSQYCPHALERLRFCRRSEYTIEDLDSLRIKTPETDPKLMQDIENAIKGLESIPDDREADREEAAPSPYAPLLPLPLSDIDAPLLFSDPLVPHVPPEGQANQVAAAAPQSVREGRGLLLSGKKKGIINLLNRWILEDERYKRRTTKTARVVGHVAGDLMGLLVSEQFRQMGMLAGSVAKAGVKEIATAGIDGIIRAIIHR